MIENSLKKFRPLNYLLAALIIAALLLLSRNIISISFSKKEPLFTVSQYKPSNNLKKKNIMEYSAILEKNPFGPPMKLRPLATEQKTESVDVSLSDLILIGTAVGPESLSYAIFEVPPGRQEVVAYRGRVLNYGVLTKIRKSSVEIERDSAVYTLKISFEKTGTKQEAPWAQRTDTAQKSFARKVGERQYILDSRRVRQSLENPERILTDARLLPNIVDGRQEGFKISEVVTGGIYHSLGLKNGDILLRVNGLEISNPEVAMQAMTALKGMNTVDLDIIRKGRNMSMNYQMR
ncbi:putative type II secretion protein GspC [bacterium BMS3Abin06]|nr:putative type II secretion protein GspC [bacterium BMS3Abin06]